MFDQACQYCSIECVLINPKLECWCRVASCIIMLCDIHTTMHVVLKFPVPTKTYRKFSLIWNEILDVRQFWKKRCRSLRWCGCIHCHWCIYKFKSSENSTWSNWWSIVHQRSQNKLQILFTSWYLNSYRPWNKFAVADFTYSWSAVSKLRWWVSHTHIDIWIFNWL